jgi:hypothetical protein
MEEDKSKLISIHKKLDTKCSERDVIRIKFSYISNCFIVSGMLKNKPIRKSFEMINDIERWVNGMDDEVDRMLGFINI